MLYCCVPAAPIDADFDVTYHTEAIKEIVQSLGYRRVGIMPEGLAVVYAQCAKSQYTGVGMSWGAGMVNVAFWYFGMPVFAFSIARSGDWIDASSATACNETSAAMQLAKESGMDLADPKDDRQRAIAAYYEALVAYVVDKFRKLYSDTDPKKLPHVTQPIDVVFAGGTSMIGGFAGLLGKHIAAGFPVPVGKIVQAQEPLLAVSRGLMSAAETDRERILKAISVEKPK